MLQLTRSRLFVAAAAACVVFLTGCSGSSSDLSAPSEATPAAATLGASAEEATNDTSEASAVLDPHCWNAGACPRQLTPTLWVDVHRFGGTMGVYPIEGTKVITAVNDSTGADVVQVWDVADPDWGRAITVEPPGSYSLQGRRTHLHDGLMAYRYGDPSDTENIGVAVYDFFADDPTTPVFEKELAGSGGFAAPLAADRFAVEIRDDTSEIQVWSLDAPEPLHTVAVPGRVNHLTGDGADTLYYIISRPDEMWQWTPPAAPELIGPAPAAGTANGARFLQVAPSGRLLVAHGEFIDVFDPSTGQTVTLTGVDAGFDNRFEALAISELPDGRIVGHYPAGETAYWNVAQPDSPTITLAEDPREWTGAGALDNGQVLQRWLISGPEAVDYDVTEAVELVTPPAP